MSQYLAAFEVSSLDGNNGFQINGVAAYDYSGSSVTSAGDVNGDGFADLIVSAPGADPNGNKSGASYVVFGKASGFGATLELSSLDGNNGFQINGVAANDWSGFSVASAGDVNGDGFDDVVVGTPFVDMNGDDFGASYVVFGKATGFEAAFELSSLDGNNGFQINGEAQGDWLGRSVASAGDVNGDGFADLIVGAPNSDAHHFRSGASYVVFGKESGFGATLDLSSLDGNNGFQINGETSDDWFGFSVASAGDVNDDGFGDLIVGAPYFDPGGYGSGASYVVFGKASGFGATLDLRSLDGNNGFQIDGEARKANSGYSVASAGDVNGDGFADLIIGADNANPNGIVSGKSYVVFGKESGFGATLDLHSLDGHNGFQINGEAAGDTSGWSVASAGDFNGDGFADLIIGADPNGLYSGGSYVMFGKASGFAAALELSSLDGNNGFQIDGDTGGDISRCSVASAGDVNGDGFADLIVGALGADPNGDFSGASYIIFGGKPGEAVVRTGTDIANTIHGGDFDDVLYGLAGDDTLIAHAGDDLVMGGDGDDTIRGGRGDDTLSGGADTDRLRGGLGADRFVYGTTGDSTGAHCDTIKRADFTADKWDVGSAVTAIDPTIVTGTLSKGSFDADLAFAADAAHLDGQHAVLFTPDAGRLAGMTFLIVDQNGIGGYQAGVDLVFRLGSAVNVGSLDPTDFI